MLKIHPAFVAVSIGSGTLLLGVADANAAKVENLAYDLGAFRIVIPSIEATGTALTDDALKGIVDPQGSATLAQRLGILNAAAIVAPQIIFEIKTGPAGNKITYRDVKLTNVGSGLIESATIGGAGGDIKDPVGGEVKINYGAISMRKVNLGLMLRVFTTQRTDPNEPMVSAYEDFTADGLQMTSKDADITMGKMTGSGVKMRALATPIGDLFTMSQQMSAPGAKPTPQQTAQIFSMVGDIFQSMELGKFEMLDMKVNVKKEPGSIGVGRVFMGGFAKGKLGEVAYENFTMNMPDGTAKLGRVGLRDLDLQRTFAAMADAAKRGDTEFRNTNPRDLVPTLGQFQISGLDLDVPDKNGAGNSPDGQRIRFSLGNFEINTSKHIDGIPTAIAAKVQNFLFPIPPKPKDVKLADIAAMGIDKFDLTHAIDLAWNEPTKELALKDYSISLGGLGSVKLSGVIGNVPKDLFSSNLALVQAAAFGAVVKSLDLSVENQGLAQKALQHQAKQSGQTPQQLQQMMVAGAAMGIPAMLGNGPAAKAIAGALSKFAADPKKVRIAARSRNGVGLADAMQAAGNPAALLESLEVTATANQ